MISYVFTTAYMFEAILLGGALIALFAWLSIRYTAQLGLMDMPNSAPHKQHTRPTPLAGGIALFGTLLVTGWLMGTLHNAAITATFGGAAVVFLFGLWDDSRIVTPPLKLTGQVLGALVMILLGLGIHIFESPEFFLTSNTSLDRYIDWILTILWVVSITNAFNFVDSMDGLAIGLGGMAAAFFMLVALDSGQPDLSRQFALLLGACIGLYYFNAPPARLFLGDSGAQTLGFVLAGLAIAYHPRGANQSSSWFVPILLLAVPIFDAALVIISRLRRRKAVYAAARDHTFHRLLAFGWESNRAVLTMQLTALFLSCIAFIVLTRQPLVANGVFLIIVLCGAGILGYLDSRERWS